MRKGILVASMILAAILMLALAGCKAGPKDVAPAEFFKGKTITVIVPYQAGGGNDVQARIFAPYYQKYLGAAVSKIENKPGASGAEGYNHLYSSAKPDGLTVGTLMGDSMTLAQLLVGKPEVQYDVADYSWVGRMFSEDQFLAVSSKMTQTTPKELAALPALKMGTSAPTTPGALNYALFANAFDLDNMRIIAGYRGTKEMALAVAQGEIHGFATELSVVNMYVKEGTMKLFATLGKDRSPEAPNVPTIYEMARQAGKTLTAEQTKWLDMGRALTAVRRSIAAPPGMSKDRLEFMRDAFMKTLQDKEWQAAWLKAGIPLEGFARGEELQKATEQIKKLSPQDVSFLKVLLKEKYVR